MEHILSALPDYDNPPVNEVVFGIQFKKLQNFKAPHIGFFWEKLGKKEYPECKEMPPLGHTIESFEGIPLQQPPLTIERFDHPPLPRLFFISAMKNQLIQTQEDRLHQNWRRIKPDDEYPRYATLYPKFKSSWSIFTSFVDEMELGNVEPDQYELTYVNQIPRGEGWENLFDINNLFRDSRSEPDNRFLPEPENMSWRKTYRLPNDTGRLHISTRLAISRELKDRILIIDLTARGFIADKIDTWFDMAHEWIVKGFTDLTSESIQKAVWKRKQ
ncbi:MAG: TIGR04255 family protein [Planctomycetes bacterium]|nr:TIGR04255 family protein [Planctomycetota bacterium]